MLTNVSPSVFSNSKYIKMKPIVSAEWNNNLYQEPYVVITGDGNLISPTTLPALSTILPENIYENFETKSFELPTGSSNVVKTFGFPNGIYNTGEAYKIVFYAKTDGTFPILVNASTEYGANSKEITSLIWTKFEIYLGWNNGVAPTSINLNVVVSNLISYNPTCNIYMTLPEMYKITRFDYENGSLWSAYSPFKFFRPGESYVKTGNAGVEYPANFRLASSGMVDGQLNQQMPISPITYNPKFALVAPPTGIYKSGIPNDMMPYQYFVSSEKNTEKIITAKYSKAVYSNKIVLKFNSIASTPTVTVRLDDVSIGSFSPDSSGQLTLYYNGTSWSTSRWSSSSIPEITVDGLLSLQYDSFSKISVEQTSSAINALFTDLVNSQEPGEEGGLQNLWMAVGAGGILNTSTNGTSWNAASSTFGSTAIRHVGYGNSLWVAVGDSGQLRTSSNSTTWITRTPNFGTSIIQTAFYANNLWLIAGASGQIRTSTNAISWITANSNFGTTQINEIGYGNNLYLIVGNTGQMRTSTDSISWATVTSTFGTSAINAVAYGNGLWIAAGAAGQIRTSTNATSWTTRTSTFGSTAINSVGYGNGLWIAAGAAGQIRISTDGTAWTTVTSNFGTTAINSVSYGNSLWFAAGEAGQLRSSTDGLAWTTVSVGFGSSAINWVQNGNIFVNPVINSSANLDQEFKRLQIIEISPRLEIDFSNFTKNLKIKKSLDSGNQYVPISFLNANDAAITISSIPFSLDNTPIPIFSNESNLSNVALKNMLTKNVKFYINFLLDEYAGTSISTTNTYIPGGVFYSDSWSEDDAEEVEVSMYDAVRYLQTMPVPDYVVNSRSIFEIITNLLDVAGFTDYDYDSLYAVCNDPSLPLDVSYYYSNSKDLTIAGALSEIFLAYQIGAYVDEYGILKFLSLSSILKNTTQNIDITDAQIIDGGYSATSSPEPGKISLRYQSPKIKQSLALQNMNDFGIKQSPSFILATSNDVVWSQQSLDSVGFNYLSANMGISDTSFQMRVADLLDIFHTYSLNSNGFAAIEDEIVSFAYKEYIISKVDGVSNLETVTVKNDIELGAEINRYIKKYKVGLIKNDVVITGATGNGLFVTYEAENNFKVGDSVSISGISPDNLNISGTVVSATSTDFQIANTSIDEYESGGIAIANTDFDIKITPTGKISNVQRGAFNSKVSAHSLISTLASKSISSLTSGGSSVTVTDSSNPENAADPYKINVYSVAGTGKSLVYPTSNRDAGNNYDLDSEKYLGYQTYVTKINFENNNVCGAGIFFNRISTVDQTNTYYVEIIRGKIANNSYKYYCCVYYNDGTNDRIIAYSDITSQMNSILSNMPKILIQTSTKPSDYKLKTNLRSPIILRVTHYPEEKVFGNVANDGDRVLDVFINNIEVSSWTVPNDLASSGFAAIDVNKISGNRKKISLPIELNSSSTIFGVYGTVNPISINSSTTGLFTFSPANSNVCRILEIYATQSELKEQSANYFYQDKRFLNGALQGKNMTETTYCMQTRPAVSGINYYDVQYMNPAATVVDVLPVEYLWHYFPGDKIEDQKWYQTFEVKKSHLSYSTPINTGFRAKMMIANNAHHRVFLNKEADDLNGFTVRLNLWTHELIAPSDPEIIEKTRGIQNTSEVIQIDSNWIQSRQAAEKVLSTISAAVPKFSKSISLQIYGNPLIQIGDIVNLIYPLSGILNQRYVIREIGHSFSEGLSTELVMSVVKQGTPYAIG